MFFVCDVTNYNPKLGPAKDGKQAVSVYDRDLGNRRVVITTPEEADAFVTARKETLVDAQKKSLIDGLIATALGTAAGAGIGAYRENSKSKKINELVDKINPEYKENLKNNPGMKISAKSDILNSDAYKKYSSELRNLFSDDKNMFTKIDVSKATKKAGKYGAGIGAACAMILALFFPFARIENADRKITKAFIDNNKFEKPEPVDESIDNIIAEEEPLPEETQIIAKTDSNIEEDKEEVNE